MPTYEYKCPECDITCTFTCKISEVVAPTCNADKLHKDKKPLTMEVVIGKTSFVLKGRGWAKDGYK